MNRTSLRAVLSAVAITGLMSLSSCGLVDDVKDKSGQYPAQVEKNFVSSCVSNGGDTATCQCAFDEIEKNVSLEDFTKFDESISEDPNAAAPPEFEAAIRTCVNQ